MTTEAASKISTERHTQNADVLQALRERGIITCGDITYGMMIKHSSGRIYDLREGLLDGFNHAIITTNKTDPVTKKRYCTYDHRMCTCTEK
jgi:precorrin isomerase